MLNLWFDSHCGQSLQFFLYIFIYQADLSLFCKKNGCLFSIYLIPSFSIIVKETNISKIPWKSLKSLAGKSTKCDFSE